MINSARFCLMAFSLTNSTIVLASNAVAVDREINSFYGIPLSLLYDDVDRLGMPYTKGALLAEGVSLRTVTFSVRSSIAVTAVFDRRGRVAELRTSSPAAEDGNGIRVGSSLADVQKAWPGGKLYYGNGEAGRYAIYFTGTNIGFRMSAVSSASKCPERKVEEIIATPYRLKL